MSIIEYLSLPIWQQIGLTLVHFLWQGAAIVLLVSILIRLVRLDHGNERYGTYLIAFIIMSVCPIITFITINTSTDTKVTGLNNATEFSIVGGVSPNAPLSSDGILLKPDAAKSIKLNHVVLGSLTLLDKRISNYLYSSLPWILAVWLVGVLILSVRLLMGFIGVRCWYHSLQQLPERLQQRVFLLCRRLRMQNFLRILISQSAKQAMAVGYLRPMILLPAAMLIQMSPDMLEAVIAHELAHIRRFDTWINLIQRMVETLLFFHPAVWWLSGCLRSERELCCDELAVKATGKHLVYASTLKSISQSEFMAKQLMLAAGLGHNKKEVLSRVRRVLGMAPLAQQNSSFWMAGVISIIFLVVFSIPASLALTAENNQKNSEYQNIVSEKQSVNKMQENNSEPYKLLISGIVEEDLSGKPIAGALVRVAVPSIDMRSVRIQTKHKIYEIYTDTNGRFKTEVTIEGEKDISVDALAPGFRSAAGTYYSGGNVFLQKMPLDSPLRNMLTNLKILLPKGIYISGTVRDENGNKIQHVNICGQINSKTSTHYVARTETDKDGKFELFDFPLDKRPDGKGVLVLSSPQFEKVTISDLYDTNEAKLAHLEIVMPRGLKITGAVLDDSNRPVTNTCVEARSDAGEVLKKCETSPDGRFELCGLSKGTSLSLIALTSDANQKCKEKLTLTYADQNVMLKLQPVKLAEEIKTFDFLGMKVSDVNPSSEDLFDLYHDYGVVILEPGNDYQRLGIGELKKGYSFWVVGNKTVHNLKEMIPEILRINTIPKVIMGMIDEGCNGAVRVVYEKPGAANTQYLKITDSDVKQLQELGKKLGIPGEQLYENVVIDDRPQKEEYEKLSESASKLHALKKAVVIFANNHGGKFPDTLQKIRANLLNPEWFDENIEYSGKGKTLEEPSVLIAYDKNLLKSCKGLVSNIVTVALFNDQKVVYIPDNQLEKLGIRSNP